MAGCGSPETDPQKVLRSALARAGWSSDTTTPTVDARRGTPHLERHGDATQRRCPVCGAVLWPRALPQRLRFHDLRHTTATLLLRSGVDAHRVQRIMRHSDVRTTLGIYGHLDVEDLRDAVATLPNDASAAPSGVARGAADDGAAERAASAAPQRRAAGAVASRLATGLLPADREQKNEGPAAPIFSGAAGPYMEREKGFESGISRAVSAAYVTPEDAPRSPSQPPDASGHVSTETLGGDTEAGAPGLPVVTPELFLEPGLIAAERASRSFSIPSLVEEVLHQAVRQVTVLRGSASKGVNHS